ncbi:MAG: NYN domain-containing protein [Cytophagales bacterium]|nr:NYN domain-containing protein [Cytophagales bacterium]
MQDKLIRIGVFYDGNYFWQVSNYYAYSHARKKRLSIPGLHEFIRHQVAEEEGSDVRLCQIVDAHYFRGRLNAYDASQRGDMIFWDRVFDDVLMNEGINMHYLPLKNTYDGQRHQEKGIDVWLALEAYEMAVYKKFNVLVLIASDGDYVPLIRKLNTLGTRVMVLSWDFEYTTDTGQRYVTRTSQDLLEEVTYPVAMHEIIDNRVRRNDPLINNLFVNTELKKPTFSKQPSSLANVNDGEILSLKNGYGFIKYPPNNLFFHYSTLIDTDFNDLQVGDKVEFTIERSAEGQEIAKNVRVILPSGSNASNSEETGTISHAVNNE